MDHGAPAPLNAWLDSVRGWRAARALVMGLALIVYADALPGGFVWCDHYLVEDNAAVRSLADAPALFTGAWGEALDDPALRLRNQGYYRPVALSSYALNHALLGHGPLGFRLVNVLLFALTAWAALSLLAGLTGSRLTALVGALLFAVHPVHTEVVDVTCYRTSLLSGLFLALALGAHLRWMQQGRARALVALAIGAGAAFLSKEEAFILPALMLCVALVRARRPDWRRLGASLGVVALTAAPALIARALLTRPVPLEYCPACGPLEMALTMMHVVTVYARLLVLPHPLTSFYDWSLIPPAFDAGRLEIWLGLSLVIGALLLLRHLVRRAHTAAAALLACGLAALLPYSHLLPLFDIAGERFLFVPSLFFMGLLAMPLAAGISRGGRARAASLVVLAVALVGWGGLTVQRNLEWRDDASILEAAARDHPQSVSAWIGLGDLRSKDGDCEAALAAYGQATRRAPALAATLDRALPCVAARGAWPELERWTAACDAHGGIPSPQVRAALERARHQGEPP